MNPGDGLMVAGLVVVLVASGAAVDLHRVEAGSITLYTTPALRDVLEKFILPSWDQRDGRRVEPVYLAAGQEYNRLRMSGAGSEADLFLHASPLFLEKGFDQGYFLGLDPAVARDINASYVSERNDTDGVAWLAFAWSPLVEVFSPEIAAPPDLAASELRFGFPHPTLSNNGVYAALFFDNVSRAAGDHARGKTVVQPVNARTNILGVADGSFDVTLGYEAIAEFFLAQGASFQYAAPLVGGREVSTPVLFAVGLVDGPHTSEARAFVQMLFSDTIQTGLAKYHLHPVGAGPSPESPLARDLEMVEFDWHDWETIEAGLLRYEVRATYG